MLDELFRVWEGDRPRVAAKAFLAGSPTIGQLLSALVPLSMLTAVPRMKDDIGKVVRPILISSYREQLDVGIYFGAVGIIQSKGEFEARVPLLKSTSPYVWSNAVQGLIAFRSLQMAAEALSKVTQFEPTDHVILSAYLLEAQGKLWDAMRVYGENKAHLNPFFRLNYASILASSKDPGGDRGARDCSGFSQPLGNCGGG